MRKGYLSLGSNLGDRKHNLEQAIIGLKVHDIDVTAVSDAYETRAVEVPNDQGPYLNVVVEIRCGLEPFRILEICRLVEDSLGRERPYHHAPRTIDIDILWLEDVGMETIDLTIPHPGMEQRSFVIHPLAQIAPQLILPSGRPIMEVKNALGYDEIIEICPMPR
jgi:2-amino-4-hydroxy-6-hydroxymethyldihydropteridine diphosphokinase